MDEIAVYSQLKNENAKNWTRGRKCFYRGKLKFNHLNYDKMTQK